MLKKISNILFSTRLMAMLFVIYALAMAVGTFLDAGQDTSPTPYTRTLIYNAFWFEAIMGLFVVNFVGNIFRYKLLRKEKVATLLVHLSFILIFSGAFVTRYFGYEGMMSIREGATESEFLSSETYITAFIDGERNGTLQRKTYEQDVDFSPRLSNKFNDSDDFDGKEVDFELVEFVPGAEKDIIPGDIGESYLKIVESSGGKPHNHFLKEGETQSIHNVLFTLNSRVNGAVNITSDENGIMTIDSPFDGSYLTMATMNQGQLIKDSIQPLHLRSRYIIGNFQFVLPKPVVKGEFGIVKKSKLLKGDEDGIKLKVTANGESKLFNVVGGKGTYNAFEKEKVGGYDISVRYGAKVRKLPFSIKLNDFEAERYPGTQDRYSAFSSKVTVVEDGEDPFNYKIFMNNILDHKGYRFFQSSFDPDEKGTILSVNHDFYGTWLTYIGYILLFLSLTVILFERNSRFASLKKMLDKVKDKKSILLVLLAFGYQFNFAQQHNNQPQKPTKAQIDSTLKSIITPKSHADTFGKLVVQDVDGRMMPANTFGSEILRKISKHDNYEGLDSNQILLSMQEHDLIWFSVPIIYLKAKKADSIRRIIGVDKTVKYVTLSDFINADGTYKLQPYLEEAYKAQIPNGFQKEFKETDQRVNLLYNTIGAKNLRIFPIPNDENNKWISPIEYAEGFNEKIKDTLYGTFIANSFTYYLTELQKAKQSGDFTSPNKLLDGFKNNQHKQGESVMLSDQKIKTELLYNKYDIFKKLFSWFLYAGALMFIFLIVQIFYNNKFVNVTVKVFKFSIFFLFILHTLGLIVRWYLSGHAPWSDAYESMIYVAWATMLFGLIFGSKSDLTIASTAFVTSMILMVAHWNWMDPAIANLQPVLNSYWLMIHVAVIVASYGPFTLGMILAFVSLLLMIFTTKDNYKKLSLNVKELTIITEMTLTVGLVMLTIGNFLGGMWANESWGRYWGWDPKETWALISIIVYAFVIHMRLVPGLRSRFAFNLAAVLAYASILMTYFGVNFYLAGLHSYASGDQILSVKFIVSTLAVISVISFFAYRKFAKFYKK